MSNNWIKTASAIAAGVFVGMVSASMTLVWIDFQMWGAR